MATNLVIEALGGTKSVADALNLPINTVANWSLPGRDIPWKRRHIIARLAAERGVSLPEDYWAEVA
jgi:hypothetical protein